MTTPHQLHAVHVALICAALSACNPSSEAPAPAAPERSAAPASAPAAAPPPPPPAVLGSVSPKAPDKARWVEVTPEKVQQGKALFGTCIGCHGEDAGGRLGMGPRIASATYLAAASDDFLFNTIKNGRAGTTMIPWGSSLKDDQIESLIAYLRSMHPVEPAEVDYALASGEAESGSKVFRSVCSGCHGRFGAGYQETANGTGIGRKAFLDSAPDGFIRYIVQHGKTLTQMKGFAEHEPTAVANLTPKEIDDTIAYLRKNAW